MVTNAIMQNERERVWVRMPKVVIPQKIQQTLWIQWIPQVHIMHQTHPMHQKVLILQRMPITQKTAQKILLTADS